MTATVGSVGEPLDALLLWPQEDSLRLLSLLGLPGAAHLMPTCKALQQRFLDYVVLQRTMAGDPVKSSAMLEAQQALQRLEYFLDQAVTLGLREQPMNWTDACLELTTKEAQMHTEMRYVHAPDWDVKPGILVSKKGTWLKPTTRFSWEIPFSEKLYLPQGVSLPVLQIGKVTDVEELNRHEWSAQHLRVWLRPSLVKNIEARRHVWFVYYPHWHGDGMEIVSTVDSWLKRSTQMSGDLQPFELVYVPKGMRLRLSKSPEPPDEPWEKNRHQHVHQHRKVTLAKGPLTIRRDKYDIFVGQGDERTPMLG